MIVAWLALPPEPTTGELVMKRKPPRSRWTPGAMKASFSNSRDGTGSSWICSGTMLVEASIFIASTIGASAVTVISSAFVMLIVAVSLAVCPTLRTSFSSSGLKPASSNLTVYSAGARAGARM